MSALDHKPHITMDDGADLVSIALTKRTGRAGRHHRRNGRDHHRRHPPARHGQRRRADVPHHRRERRATPSTCSTTATAPASRPSTASSAPPTSCSPAPSSWSPATAGAAADWLQRARGMGAEVIVTEIDPTKAIEAVMDGYRVMSHGGSRQDRRRVLHRYRQQERARAASTSKLMKDGAIISNSGHFNVEIDIPALEKMSSSKRTTRNFVEEYSHERRPQDQPSGRRPPDQPGRR